MSLLPPKSRPGAIVPAVPPLDAIKDAPTREAIRALADGWQTRNGFKGDGTNRFITEADLKSLDFKKLGNQTIAGAAFAGLSTDPSIPQSGQISAAVGDLAAMIYESPLFKYLGQHVDLIDANLAYTTQQLGSTIAGLGSTITTTINADTSLVRYSDQQYAIVAGNAALAANWIETNANTFSAYVNSVNQLQVTVNNLNVALATEQTVRANADGSLYAQYTVKIDNNGYISGFGLASTVNNSTALSEFYIRADRFAIASPTVPHVVGQPAPAPNIPFIVQTTPWVDSNGVTQPAGVYMRSAFIEYAGIDTARIRDAAVGTLKIGADAVTVAKSATLSIGPSLIYCAPANQDAPASGVELYRCAVDYRPAPGDFGTQAVLNSKYVPGNRIVILSANLLAANSGPAWCSLYLKLVRYFARWNAGTGQFEIDPSYAGWARGWPQIGITTLQGMSQNMSATILDTDLLDARPYLYFLRGYYCGFEGKDPGVAYNSQNITISVFGGKR